MSNKTIIVVAPTKNAEPLKDELFERFGKDHDIVFADSFAAAMMMDKNTVFLIEPIDLPPPIPDLHVILQEHDIQNVSLHSSHLMNEGRDSEITSFNRRMYLHTKLVESFTKKDLGVVVDVVQTPVEDYTELLTRIVPTTPLRGNTAEMQFIDDAGFQKPAPEFTQEDPAPQAVEVESFKSEVQETPISETLNEISEPESKVEDLAQHILDNGLPETQTADNYPQLPMTEEEKERAAKFPDNLENVELTGTLDFNPQATVTHVQPIPPLEEQPSVEFVKPTVEQGSETIVTEETKQLEPSSAPEVDFDPIAAAFETSVTQAQNESTSPTPPSNEPVDESLAQSEDPKYPQVDSTVEVPPKLFSESKSSSVPYLSDWGGSHLTYGRVFDGIDRKVNFALNNNRQPKLNPFEQHVVQVSNDAIANEELHKQQYVEGARWSSYVTTPTTRVPVFTPIKNPDYGDAKYIGTDAVSLLQNRMEIGCKLGVFLPHTGIYFILNSPDDEEVLNTLSVINNYRIEALRASSGILLGNSNFYLYRQVLNLFINNLAGCSLSSWNKEVLLGLIDERDMNIISAALAASIYPDGYEYRQACGLVKGKKTCEHITAKLLDLRRLVFVDNSRLSETQRQLAAGGLRERSLNEIKTYQDTNYLGFKKAYEITPGISFVYKAQPINVVIEAGEQWIKEIESTVDSIVTFNEDEETRNNEIRRRINLARIREYGHWVVEIQVDGESNTITDRTKINQLLKSLSRKQNVLDKVSETLSEFQRLSQIAVVAVPRVACESCGQTDQKDLDISPHLIPQDATSRFFTLAHQRLS